MMAYCKIHLYEELLDSDLPEDPYLAHDLERYFPEPLPERYGAEMRGHRLRREIIATSRRQPARRPGRNDVRLPPGARRPAPRLRTWRAPTRSPARYSRCARFWSEVEALDNRIEAGTQLRMLLDGRRLVERATRWLVRAHARHDRHRGDHTAVRAGRPDAGRSAARRARGARPGGVRCPPGRARGRRGSPGAGPAGGEHAGAAVRVRHRRGCRRHRTAAVDRDGDLLRDRRQARPGLAARPDPRSAPRPIAGRRWPGRRCATTCTGCTAR